MHGNFASRCGSANSATDPLVTGYQLPSPSELNTATCRDCPQVGMQQRLPIVVLKVFYNQVHASALSLHIDRCVLARFLPGERAMMSCVRFEVSELQQIDRFLQRWIQSIRDCPSDHSYSDCPRRTLVLPLEAPKFLAS